MKCTKIGYLSNNVLIYRVARNSTNYASISTAGLFASSFRDYYLYVQSAVWWPPTHTIAAA